MPEQQQNITNIPSSRVDFIDKRTGLISREWYRFFLNLFNLAGAGGNQISLDDLQVGPPPQPATSSAGTGTVTSVTGTSPVVSSGGATPAISLASGYGDTQNPYASKTANFVLAAPNGVAGVPTFRAIVAADIPTLNQNTTGTAANVTGIVAVANGGTGVTTSTGTGNTVLSTSPTLTTPIITALDTQFTLQDDVDPTKQANFQLSGLTTGTTFTYTLPAQTGALATLGALAQTFAGNVTFSGNVSMTSSSFTRTATTQAWLDGSMTTAAWTVGGTAQTGIITLGRSTAAQTLNIANGATATATTKTVNIGTDGLSGSTTAINIGSAVAGATTTTSVYGNWTFNTAIGIASGGTGQTTAAAAFNALSPVTSTGDLIIGNGANSATRLAIGANNYVLTSNGTTATWAVATGSGATITNDTTTSTNVYPLFAGATSGSLTTAYTGNANYLYKPSTGELTATAHVSSNGIQINATTVATSYTIATGNNGLSAGPVSVSTGVTVTVSTGSTWVVV